MLETFSRIPLIGQTVIILLFLAIAIATALVAERIRFWAKVSKEQPRFAKALVELYRDQPDLVNEKIKRNIDLPIARIFAAALKLDHPTPETFRLAMESELQAEVPVMKRFNSFLEALVGLAPLLGLLGTISGLITSFGSLNIGDIGGTKTAGVSAGISEALLTTAAGLIVAAFALVFASIFRAQYQRQLALIQEYGGQLELIYRQAYDRTSNQTATLNQLSTAIQQLAESHRLSKPS
jgi:biopolymer transport protein ExbB